MNGARFDALARTIVGVRHRRGLLRGAAAAAVAGLLAGRREGLAQIDPRPWYCPRGVDGPKRDCLCECTSYGFSTIECQAACFECKWHVDPVCPNPGRHGEAVGPPVCCADRKPCRQICGDCPECEPFPDLL